VSGDANAFDLLGQAKQHFADLVRGEQKLIEVPEWGLSLYVRPPNLRERSRMVVLSQAAEIIGFAEIVVMRARTEAGVPMFQRAQIDELATRVDSRVLERVGYAILQYDTAIREALTPEEIEKN
jgi:hypothetical protein